MHSNYFGVSPRRAALMRQWFVRYLILISVFSSFVQAYRDPPSRFYKKENRYADDVAVDYKHTFNKHQTTNKRQQKIHNHKTIEPIQKNSITKKINNREHQNTSVELRKVLAATQGRFRFFIVGFILEICLMVCATIQASGRIVLGPIVVDFEFCKSVGIPPGGGNQGDGGGGDGGGGGNGGVTEPPIDPNPTDAPPDDDTTPNDPNPPTDAPTSAPDDTSTPSDDNLTTPAGGNDNSGQERAIQNYRYSKDGYYRFRKLGHVSKMNYINIASVICRFGKKTGEYMLGAIQIEPKKCNNHGINDLNKTIMLDQKDLDSKLHKIAPDSVIEGAFIDMLKVIDEVAHKTKTNKMFGLVRLNGKHDRDNSNLNSMYSNGSRRQFEDLVKLSCKADHDLDKKILPFDVKKDDCNAYGVQVRRLGKDMDQFNSLSKKMRHLFEIVISMVCKIGGIEGIYKYGPIRVDKSWCNDTGADSDDFKMSLSYRSPSGGFIWTVYQAAVKLACSVIKFTGEVIVGPFKVNAEFCKSKGLSTNPGKRMTQRDDFTSSRVIMTIIEEVVRFICESVSTTGIFQFGPIKLDDRVCATYNIGSNIPNPNSLGQFEAIIDRVSSYICQQAVKTNKYEMAEIKLNAAICKEILHENNDSKEITVVKNYKQQKIIEALIDQVVRFVCALGLSTGHFEYGAIKLSMEVCKKKGLLTEPTNQLSMIPYQQAKPTNILDRLVEEVVEIICRQFRSGGKLSLGPLYVNIETCLNNPPDAGQNIDLPLRLINKLKNTVGGFICEIAKLTGEHQVAALKVNPVFCDKTEFDSGTNLVRNNPSPNQLGVIESVIEAFIRLACSILKATGEIIVGPLEVNATFCRSKGLMRKFLLMNLARPLEVDFILEDIVKEFVKFSCKINQVTGQIYFGPAEINKKMCRSQGYSLMSSREAYIYKGVLGYIDDEFTVLACGIVQITGHSSIGPVKVKRPLCIDIFIQNYKKHPIDTLKPNSLILSLQTGIIEIIIQQIVAFICNLGELSGKFEFGPIKIDARVCDEANPKPGRFYQTDAQSILDKIINNAIDNVCKAIKIKGETIIGSILVDEQFCSKRYATRENYEKRMQRRQLAYIERLLDEFVRFVCSMGRLTGFFKIARIQVDVTACNAQNFNASIVFRQSGLGGLLGSLTSLAGHASTGINLATQGLNLMQQGVGIGTSAIGMGSGAVSLLQQLLSLYTQVRQTFGSQQQQLPPQMG